LPKRISKKPREDEYTTVKVPNDLILDVDRLIGVRGYKSRGEIVKTAIRNFLDEYTQVRRFAIRNHDENGVKVWDNELRMHADIQISPRGIYCPLCDAHKCDHIRFALSQPDIREGIRKKGWPIDLGEGGELK
jgi:Arc/MetJ-type ribon-helix-helix transcriptional regulator